MDAIKKAIERKQDQKKEPNINPSLAMASQPVDGRPVHYKTERSPQTTFDRIKRIRRVLESPK